MALGAGYGDDFAPGPLGKDRGLLSKCGGAGKHQGGGDDDIAHDQTFRLRLSAIE